MPTMTLYTRRRRSLLEATRFLLNLTLHLVLPIHQRVIHRRQAKRFARRPIRLINALPVPETTEPETLPLCKPIQPAPEPIADTPYPTDELITPAIVSDIPATPAEMSRTELVTALLDEAWGLGHTTYPQLINYVREQSGTGCSKRVISAWKRSRGLLEAA